MNKVREVSVTMTPDLYDRLRAEARQLGIPIEWVVASMVVDTIEADCPEPALC